MNAKPLYIAHVIGYRIENNERIDLPYYFITKTAFKKFIAQEERHNGETFESPMGDWKQTCICEHETFLMDKLYK